MDPTRFEIYGAAREQILDWMRARSGAGGGASLALWPGFVPGSFLTAAA